MTVKKGIISADLLLSVGLALAFGGALLQATRWPHQASLFPIVVGSSGLVLAVVEIGNHLRNRNKPEMLQGDQIEPAAGLWRQDFGTFAWIVGILAATFLAGFQWGLPAVIMLYYRFQSKQKLFLVVILTGLCWGVVYAWTALLHLTLYPGLLARLVPWE